MQSAATKRKRVETRRKTCETRGYYMTEHGKNNVRKKSLVYIAGGVPHNKGKSIFEIRMCVCGKEFKIRRDSSIILCGICRRRNGGRRGSGRFNGYE